MDKTSAASGHALAPATSIASATSAHSADSANAGTAAPPVLRSEAQRQASVQLPRDLLAYIYNHLSVKEYGTLSQVCKLWRDAGSGLRAGALNLHQIREQRMAGAYKGLHLAQFEAKLGSVLALPPGDLAAGLVELAGLLNWVLPGSVPDVLKLLWKKLAPMPLEVQRRVLCAAAHSLSAKARAQEVDFLINASSGFPAESQALVLGALCNAMDDGDPRLDRIAAAAARWDIGALEERPSLLAVVMYGAAAGGQAENVKRSAFSHFGYYAFPFMTTTVPAHKDVRYVAGMASDILALELSLPEKIELLMHKDHTGTPWLTEALHDPARKAHSAAYIAAIASLDLAPEHAIALLSGCDRDGMPAFGKMIRDLADSRFLDRELFGGNVLIRDQTIMCSQAYIDMISGAADLPAGVRIALLRADMKGPRRTREAARESAMLLLRTAGEAHLKWIMSGRHDNNKHLDNRVPGGDAPFFGLSMMDSLFHDSLEKTMTVYMDAILKSKLSDEEKAGVLRLEHPHRLSRDNMRGAYSAYAAVIRRSRLPPAMKQDLQKDIRILFDTSCTVL